MSQPGWRNARVILQSMTGNTGASTAMIDVGSLGLLNRYCLLQKFIPNVLQGEKRVIIAGGKVVGQHGRRLPPGDHRSNLTQGGSLCEANLSAPEEELCSEIGNRLIRSGVGSIGIDLAFPYVLEFNIVNPGGIYEILELTGIDYTSVALDYILASRL